MSVGGVEFGRAMARQLAEAREKMADKRARSQERWEGKRVQDERPSEGLACPACSAEFAFGYNCAECGEPLVSASLVEAGPAPKPSFSPGKPALALVIFASPYVLWFAFVELHRLLW